MAKKPPLGSGARFKKLRAEIAAHDGDVRDPGAIAAAAGRAKYGTKRMAELSLAGRKRAAARRR